MQALFLGCEVYGATVVLPAVITDVDCGAHSMLAFTEGDSSCSIFLSVLSRHVLFAIKMLSRESDVRTRHDDIPPFGAEIQSVTAAAQNCTCKLHASVVSFSREILDFYLLERVILSHVCNTVYLVSLGTIVWTATNLDGGEKLFSTL